MEPRSAKDRRSSMRIAVIGAGAIGRTLSGRLAGSGHDVTVGVRSPGSAARDEFDARVGVASVEDAIAAAEAVMSPSPAPRSRRSPVSMAPGWGARS
jgi:predicted dinucleotide-binding enzyme